MIKYATFLSLFVLLTIPPAATAAVVEVTLESTGYAGKILPLGSTVNNDIVVFYDHYYGGQQNLRARVIGPAGGLGPVQTVATNIDFGKWDDWDAVWSPKAKRYMAVYRKGNKVYAQLVRPNATKQGGAKNLFDNNKDHLCITWTSQKKFVLFVSYSNQVTALILKKNGAPHNSAQIITNVASGEAYPVDAATENNGTAMAYYVHFNSNNNTATPSVIRVNQNLNVQGDFNVGVTASANSKSFARYIRGAYESKSKRHSMVWRIGAGPSKYCTFKNNGNLVKSPTNTPEDVTPRALLNDRNKKKFAMFYFKLNYFDGADHSEFYHFTYKPSGSVISNSVLLKQTENENDAHGCGLSRSSNIFVGWVNDGGPAGIHGRLIN